MKPTGSIIVPNNADSKQIQEKFDPDSGPFRDKFDSDSGPFRDKFDFDSRQIRVGTPVRVGKKHRVRVLSSAYTTRFRLNQSFSSFDILC